MFTAKDSWNSSTGYFYDHTSFTNPHAPKGTSGDNNDALRVSGYLVDFSITLPFEDIVRIDLDDKIVFKNFLNGRVDAACNAITTESLQWCKDNLLPIMQGDNLQLCAVVDKSYVTQDVLKLLFNLSGKANSVSNIVSRLQEIMSKSTEISDAIAADDELSKCKNSLDALNDSLLQDTDPSFMPWYCDPDVVLTAEKVEADDNLLGFYLSF